MQITLPVQVKKIIKKLEDNGYEGYAVGGCVRDSILGREPDDWDITTSASPQELKALFPRTIDTGIQHGTVTVLMEGKGYEVTTYRVDGEYEDSRHPREVMFTASLAEDLKRRDFTINAMAYSEKRGLVDQFGGVEDLEQGVIRCVGEPGERFSEDVLRILRAVRFSAQLGFSIEEGTRGAIEKQAPNLVHISAERIQTELVKLMLSSHPEYLRVAYETGITEVILPEFHTLMETPQNNPHHKYTVGEHTLEALRQIRPDKVLRLAVLFHDFGKPLVRSTDEAGIDHFYGHGDVSAELAKLVLKRFKFDNDTMSKVCRLVKCHDLHGALQPKSIRKMIYRVGEDIFPLLLEVQRADILAQSEEKQADKLEALDKTGQLFRGIKARQECLSLKGLAVKGGDLIADGIPPGKEIGRILDCLLQQVLENPERNTKDYLIEYSKTVR